MPSEDELRAFSPQEDELYDFFQGEPLNWLVLDYERYSNSPHFERDPRQAFRIFCEMHAVKDRSPMLRLLGKSRLTRDEQSKLTFDLLPSVSWTDVQRTLSWPKVARGLQKIPNEKLTPKQERLLLGRELLFREIAFGMRLARDRLDPIPAPPPHGILCVANDDNDYAYLRKPIPAEEDYVPDEEARDSFDRVLDSFEKYAGEKSLSYHKADALEIFVDQMLEPCWKSFVEMLGMERGRRMIVRGTSAGVGFEEIKEAVKPIRYSNETLFRAYVIALSRTHYRIVDIFKRDWERAPGDVYEASAPWGSPSFYNGGGGQKGREEDHVHVWLADNLGPVALKNDDDDDDDDDDNETASMPRRANSAGGRKGDKKDQVLIWPANDMRAGVHDDDEAASMPRRTNGAGCRKENKKDQVRARLANDMRTGAQDKDVAASMPRHANRAEPASKHREKEARPEEGTGQSTGEHMYTEPRATQPEAKSRKRKRKSDEVAEPNNRLMTGTTREADGKVKKRPRRWESRDENAGTVVVSNQEASTGHKYDSGDGGGATNHSSKRTSDCQSRYNLRSRRQTEIKPP